jgi:hypothetical protein
MSTNPDPQFAPGSFTVPRHPQAPPGAEPPELVKRIPDKQPLVLKSRFSRFLTVFGALYLGIPLAILLGVSMLLFAVTGIGFGDLSLIMLVAYGALVLFGLTQMALLISIGMAGGPVLAANTDGLWIRVRKWPARSVYLPWSMITRIYPRRWLWDRAICVVALDPRVGSQAGVFARIDMAMQKALVGSRLTASTYYSGCRADDVLMELHRLSGGRVHIG